MSSTNNDPTSDIGPQRVLVVDDEPVIALSIRRALAADGHEVTSQADPHRGLEMALTGDHDVVFLDLKMPGLDGMEILSRLKQAGTPSQVVMITGHSTVETAVQAMKLGAADYLSKPFTPDQIKIVLQKAARKTALVRENAALRKELEVNRGFEGIIGESRPMERVFALIKRVAPTDGTVLITGESGTGKEMVVKALHRLSRRRHHELMACDCSALAPTLLESELFGHVKGSFSGAIGNKQGLFEAADRGTLFLDEIANLNMETQGKLLRVLESKKVKKVGDTGEHDVDIRLVGATNRDLSELVASGEFREDLYYRLNVVPIDLPALRDRHGDIPRLVMFFLERFCRKLGTEAKKFSPEAMRRMEGYAWPGNVRELRNIVERIAILCDREQIEPEHLPQEIRGAVSPAPVSQLPHTWDEFKQFKQKVRDAAVVDLERRFLTEALRRCEGNVSRAAEAVGMQRTNFHALMRRCQVTAEDAGH